MRDDQNPIEKIISLFAERLRDAPGAARIARLARTAKHIPDPLLADLTALVVRLDDVQLVGDDIGHDLIEVAYCDLKYSDATEFAVALRSRLKRYVREPRVAHNARANLKERHAWWRMALSRTAELCRWPAIVLTERPQGINNRGDVLRKGSSAGRRM
ncbi:MAG TPA: hypothetical protein VE999_12275 [Gemmataceae bacterium]|nr:hypothetical protein [Gemmataceae bacterium]